MTEHRAMLSCVHSEADQIGPCCLRCGRIAFDPSKAILAISVAYMAFQALRWVIG